MLHAVASSHSELRQQHRVDVEPVALAGSRLLEHDGSIHQRVDRGAHGASMACTCHMSLKERIRTHALELGFDAVGFARADLPLDEDFARWEAFVAQNLHGPMTWLAAHREARRRPASAAILEGARTVVCVAERCAARTDLPDRDDLHSPVVARIARYARGRDYHNHLKKKLKRLAGFIESIEPATSARALCDTAPIFERAWAARAGLGFIGKNGMLIRPGFGSHLLLGEVVSTIAIDPDPPSEHRCAGCSRCLDACPTQAFLRPFVLDPRRCISCLTIEQRGAWAPELEPLVGGAVFGCDACQQVCPHNASKRASLGPGTPYDPLPVWTSQSIASLLSMAPQDLSPLLEGSPLKRPGLDGLRRNLIVAAGNAPESDAAPLLRDVLRGLDPPWLQETAQRALQRLGG